METTTNNKAIIITGGPGMGKTAIIEELQRSGYCCMPETGRAVIRAQVKAGGTALPWMDKRAFALEMFRRSVSDFAAAQKSNTLTFFDRGLPDVAGYLELSGLKVPQELAAAARRLRYQNQVFITPPWEEIYRNDQERKQSFAEAVRTYEVMGDVYTRYGYSLIEVPKLTIAERALFILDHSS